MLSFASRLSVLKYRGSSCDMEERVRFLGGCSGGFDDARKTCSFPPSSLDFAWLRDAAVFLPLRRFEHFFDEPLDMLFRHDLARLSCGGFELYIHSCVGIDTSACRLSCSNHRRIPPFFSGSFLAVLLLFQRACMDTEHLTSRCFSLFSHTRTLTLLTRHTLQRRRMTHAMSSPSLREWCGIMNWKHQLITTTL